MASWLVGQLPGEDGIGRLVAADNGVDVLVVLCLDLGVRVPGRGIATEVACVGAHSAIVAPVVGEVDDQLDIVRFGASDDGIQTLEPVGTGVDGRLLAWNEGLEPYAGCCGRDIVESPYTKNLEA